MELLAVLSVGALVFGGLSLARAHWFRLADCLYRLGPARLRAIGWPAAHPFSHVDPKADGQNGALGVFPHRTARLRVLVHGLPAPDLPPEAHKNALGFRLWAGAVGALIAGASIAIHPAAPGAAILAIAAAWIVAPRWSGAPGAATEDTR